MKFPRAGTVSQAASLLTAIIACAFITTGWMLKPDPDGHGTHTQLGLPPCGLMVNRGIPCPT